MADDGKRVCGARIGAPHGVRGAVRLFAFTADPADVARELGLSVNAVLIAKSRVLQRLREEGRGLVD